MLKIMRRKSTQVKEMSEISSNSSSLPFMSKND